MSVASAHPVLGYYRATYNQALQDPSLEDVQKRIIAGPVTVPLVVAELPPSPPKECSVANGARRGTGDGQFQSPASVAVAPDSSIYVADRNNHRIRKFSLVH